MLKRAKSLVVLLSISGFTTAAFAGTIRCEDCGPGSQWMAGCAAGTDEIVRSKAEVGIYPLSDPTCAGDPQNFVLRGPVTIDRAASTGTEIATEIVSMDLAGAGITLIAGAGNGAITQASLGTIVEQAANDSLADSTFNVFFEANVTGIGLLWNQDPLEINAVITCVPPEAEYIHPEDQCVPLYDDPVVGQGMIVAYLGQAKHQTFPPIPTLSEWGLVAMVLLLLVAGSIVINRSRSPKATVAKPVTVGLR